MMVLGGYNSDGSLVLDTSEIGTPSSFFGVTGGASKSAPARSWTPAF